MRTILAITDIAYIEDPIFNGPMMAQGLGDLIDGDFGRIPTADPSGHFLTAPLGIVRPTARTADLADQPQVLPASFLLQVGRQFNGIHQPDFAPFDPAVSFAILDQIRRAQRPLGKKSALRPRHQRHLSTPLHCL